MIFYGTRATRIGFYPIEGTTCPHCDKGEIQHISVFGKYAHIYWIPFFPIGKKAVSECTHCLRTVEQRDFSKELNQLYREPGKKSQRPIWHWTGLIIVAALVGLLSLPSRSSDKDERRALLKADISKMTSTPTREIDSVAVVMKAFFSDFANEELNPSEFEYLTRVKGDKVLMLMKIPDLKHVEKDGRFQVVEMINMLADIEPSFEGRERYIGVHGRYNLMIIKTPSTQDNRRIVSQQPLYSFYGPKAVPD